MKTYHRLILVLFSSIAASQNSPYTIQSLPAYSLQRQCVQLCVSYPYNLPYYIGCPINPALNACVCRSDVQSSASTFLTSCVNQGCNTNPPDLSSAIGLYDSYCSMNGYPIVGVPATTTAATSLVTSLATVIIVPTATVTATATSTSSLTSVATTISSIASPPQSSSTPSSTSTTTSTSTTASISGTTAPIPTPNPSSTNAGAIAGGVVGGLAVIAIIAAILFLYRHRMRKQQHLEPGPSGPTPAYGASGETWKA